MNLKQLTRKVKVESTKLKRQVEAAPAKLKKQLDAEVKKLEAAPAKLSKQLGTRAGKLRKQLAKQLEELPAIAADAVGIVRESQLTAVKVELGKLSKRVDALGGAAKQDAA